MHFFPNGVMSGEVVDPDKLSKEFLEAAALAGQTDQWNWIQNVLALSNLSREDRCTVESVSQTCDLQSTQGAFPILPNAVGADATIWKIPYKRGFYPIGEGTSAGNLELRWTSAYPELVMIILTCQYVRAMQLVDYGYGTMPVGLAPTPRAQIRISVDGAVQPGTGPFGVPIYNPRGTGYAASAGAISTIFMGIIPAGTHVVQGMGGQSEDTAITEETTFSLLSPVGGVCVGNRALYAVRFARGDTLQGG